MKTSIINPKSLNYRLFLLLALAALLLAQVGVVALAPTPESATAIASEPIDPLDGTFPIGGGGGGATIDGYSWGG